MSIRAGPPLRVMYGGIVSPYMDWQLSRQARAHLTLGFDIVSPRHEAFADECRARIKRERDAPQQSEAPEMDLTRAIGSMDTTTFNVDDTYWQEYGTATFKVHPNGRTSSKIKWRPRIVGIDRPPSVGALLFSRDAATGAISMTDIVPLEAGSPVMRYVAEQDYEPYGTRVIPQYHLRSWKVGGKHGTTKMLVGAHILSPSIPADIEEDVLESALHALLESKDNLERLEARSAAVAAGKLLKAQREQDEAERLLDAELDGRQAALEAREAALMQRDAALRDREARLTEREAAAAREAKKHTRALQRFVDAEAGTADARCAVCFVPFAAGTEAALTPCDHLMCDMCLRPWVRKERACPTCRGACAEADLRVFTVRPASAEEPPRKCARATTAADE